MGWCPHCAKNLETVRGDEGFICCASCGKVVDSDMFTDEPTFIKGAGGQSQLSGRYIRSVESGNSESREKTLANGRDEISSLVQNLSMTGQEPIINAALSFYKLAVDRNFTRGRKRNLVTASCLYIACREDNRAYLLIDFSNQLCENVYVLGAVFLQLCQLLRLQNHPIMKKLVDPVLFIPRFTHSLLMLLDERKKKLDLLGSKTRLFNDIERTARRILASMKRDWMQTGRKPSGLCGAALYISAHSFGLECSKSDVESIVHVCEATLTKRLIEFENTESGNLTIEEFNLKADELEKEPKLIKSSEARELLCKHNESETPHFANGLCKECYDECEKEVEEGDPFSQPNPNVNVEKKLDSQRSEGVVNEHQTVEEGVCGQSIGHEDIDNTGDESESFSDIDDVEVNGYLHDEEEKRLKTKIWESLNWEYLEEEAAKEAAAKEAEAKFRNWSEGSLDAKQLAAATEAALANSKKERRQKRAADAKNAAPAKTAAEATRQMLTKKGMSFNFDVLNKIFEDPPAPKKPRTESDSKDNANGQQNVKGEEEVELDLVDNDDDIGHNDEFGDDYSTGDMYGDDLYHRNNNEDYGY
ncbi:hypothetical protein IFM89_003443 [Coptis chinensis]|uniref:Cyclin-like domain-containing protein n=1 Tax=Coptis chinensis TaxID=261450 RepID=A0A835HAF7_9MAGN|nr:hypothetical protein IFM89_003443 [Coptis chinensis]